MIATPAEIERAAEAMWNSTAGRKWAEIPEEWKPFYRGWAKAALEAA